MTEQSVLSDGGESHEVCVIPKDLIGTVEGIYKEAGCEDYEDMAKKALMVMQFEAAMKEKNLTPTQARKVLRMGHHTIHRILRGHFKRYTVEQLEGFVKKILKQERHL